MPFSNIFLSIFVLLGEKIISFESFKLFGLKFFTEEKLHILVNILKRDLRLKVAEIITCVFFFCWRICYGGLMAHFVSRYESKSCYLALIHMAGTTAASKYKIYSKLGSEWNESNSRQRGLWVYILTYIGLLGFAFIRKARLAFAWMWYIVQLTKVLQVIGNREW